MEITAEKPFITVKEVSIKIYDVFLDEEIEEPSKYRDLISILFNAEEEDEVNLFINNVGGSVDSACSIIEALKSTKANTSAILLGQCHSASSLIMMYCKNIYVTDSAYALIHTATSGSFGTVSNIQKQAEFVNTKINRLMQEAYKGFLSEEEIEKLHLGLEFWFDADEIRKRLEQKEPILTEEEEENDKDCQSPKKQVPCSVSGCKH